MVVSMATGVMVVVTDVGSTTVGTKMSIIGTTVAGAIDAGVTVSIAGIKVKSTTVGV